MNLIRMSNIRIKVLRESYKNGLLDDEDIEFQYKNWKDKDMFLTFVNDVGKEFTVKGSKRGNVIYAKNVYKKLVGLKKWVGMDGVKRGFTKYVLATYEVDSNMCSKVQAWQWIGDFMNSLLTRMKDMFKVEYVRFWETHESGYPHVHVLYKFKKYMRIKRGYDKFGYIRNYIPRKIFLKLKCMWIEGYSDFMGVDNVYRAINYIAKYTTKQLFDVDNNISKLSMLWLFSKRVFSMSRSVVDVIKGVYNKSSVLEWYLVSLSDNLGVFHVFKDKIVENKKKFSEDILDYIMKKHLYRQVKL